MSRAVLSIGSNLGDRLGRLRTATKELAPVLVAASAVYETPPWGPVPQDSYLNAVLIVDHAATDARGWLARAHELEAAAGRERLVRWGPRTLDVDVVDVAGVVSGDPELTLPHPRAHERAFVLLPWADADPAAELTGHGPVAALVKAADATGITRRDDLELIA